MTLDSRVTDFSIVDFDTHDDETIAQHPIYDCVLLAELADPILSNVDLAMHLDLYVMIDVKNRSIALNDIECWNPEDVSEYLNLSDTLADLKARLSLTIEVESV